MGTTLGVTSTMKKYNFDGFIRPSSMCYIFPALGRLPMVTVLMGKLPAGTPINKVSPGTRLADFAGNVPIGLAFWMECGRRRS